MIHNFFDLLRDPVWQGLGVLAALFFAVIQTFRHKNRSAVAVGVSALLLVVIAQLRPPAGDGSSAFVGDRACADGVVQRVTLFVRETPSEQAEILETLVRGQRVRVLCESVTRGGVTWTRIRNERGAGWVAEVVVGEPLPHLQRM